MMKEKNIQIDKNPFYEILKIISGKTNFAWVCLFAFFSILTAFGAYSFFDTIFNGIGSWGINNQVGWGLSIVNFVFWIGVAHAGTLISSMLLISKQPWRKSIARISETMTLCAIICAIIFPVIHLGRAYLAWILLPFLTNTNIYPQFTSPLMWDLFAIGVYFLVSLIFWYISIISDFWILAKVKKSSFFEKLSLKINFSSSVLAYKKRASLIIACLASALVISVHSVVSLDFAVSYLPDWNSAIFPFYFVAGAIYSGMAFVAIIAIVARKVFALEKFITKVQIENIAKFMLLTSLIVSASYFILGIDLLNTKIGTAMLVCNFLVPGFLWIKALRRSYIFVFFASVFALIGMWAERFEIVIFGLSNAFNQTEISSYDPSQNEWFLMIGSFGLFGLLMCIFFKKIPCISLEELQEEVLLLDKKDKPCEKEDILHKLLKDKKCHCSEKKPMGYSALFGAISGFIVSFTMVYFMNLANNSSVGGRSEIANLVFSIPIFFECTLLGACAFVFARFIYLAVKDNHKNSSINGDIKQ